MRINMRKFLVLLGTGLVFGAFLASCKTGHTDQDKIRGFPYQPFLSVSENSGNNYIELPVTGLAYAKSGSRAYPDLYVFIDRNMSEVLFKKAISQFTQFTQALDANKGAGLDSGVLDSLREILVYRPGTDGTLQAVLLGNLPIELTRAAMLASGKFTQRYVTLGSHKSAWAMENLAAGIHIGLVDNGCIVLQMDDKPGENQSARNKNFNLFVQRAILLKEAKFDSILSYQSEKLRAEKKVSSAVSGTPEIDENGDIIKPVPVAATIFDAGVNSFDAVLVNEVMRPALFALATFALPGDSPARGVRIRVEPSQEKIGAELRMHVELSLKLRDPAASTQVRAGLKLALASLASMAGLDSAFLESVKIDTKDDELIISGIEMSEKHAGEILGTVMSQAGALWSAATAPADPAPAETPK